MNQYHDRLKKIFYNSVENEENLENNGLNKPNQPQYFMSATHNN
jgi:hypothetical protein